jgi:eukaryotic-like serine/threonine-protein kinase
LIASFNWQGEGKGLLKKHWKSNWFLASLLSLAFLLASGSNALQSLEHKAYDWAASATQRVTHEKMLDKLSVAKPEVIDNTVFFLESQINPGFVYTNQLAGFIAQSKTHRLKSELTQLDAMSQKVQTNLNADLSLSPEWAIWGESAVWLLVVLYLVFLFPRLTAAATVLITVGLLLTLVATPYVLMMQKGWRLQLMMPCALLLIGHVLLATKRYLVPEKSTKKSAADFAESHCNFTRMLQNQDQLGMAFNRLGEYPVDDRTVLGYMPPLNPKYKDVVQQIASPEQISKAVVSGGYAGSANEGSLMLVNQDTENLILGRYQIEIELGKGAMGVVYLGRDSKTNHPVAIKTITLMSDMDADELTALKARFFLEAETVGRLNHSGIVTVYGAGEEQGLAYLVMEFLKGEDLASYTQADHLLPTQQVIDIAIKVANALDYAHIADVVHRDIKPSNIMIEMNTGVVKVTDFGIAHITRMSKTNAGIVSGTPSYMSPEQLSGKKIDGRSDLFSLGVTLYSLLTGELPFVAESMSALMYKVANESHIDIRQLNPEFSEDLAMTVNKLLEKNPENRYQTGDEVANALKKCVIKIALV